VKARVWDGKEKSLDQENLKVDSDLTITIKYNPGHFQNREGIRTLFRLNLILSLASKKVGKEEEKSTTNSQWIVK
jgi:hypothetical protein